MIFIKILYLILVIVLISFWILYIDSIALVMLLCVLCLPFLLKGLMLALKFFSEASLTCDTQVSTAGESIPVVIRIVNRLPFSFAQLHAVVDLKHSFGVGKETMKLQFPLHARNATGMTFYVHADFCGALDISLRKLYALDYLHVFQTNFKPVQKSISILVLPKRIPIEVVNAADAVYCSDSDTFGDMAGDDPSEIFDFHEYMPGDAVSRIHWKLSSKSDKMLVKEFSTPVLKSVLVLCDFKYDTTAPQERMRESEAFLSAFYSLVCTMREQQVIPTVIWYDEKSDHMYYCNPTTHAEITDMFRNLYLSMDAMRIDVQRLLNETVGMQFSSVTFLTNDLTDVCLNTVDRNLDANQRNIIYITDQVQNRTIMTEHAVLIHATPDSMQAKLEQLII